MGGGTPSLLRSLSHGSRNTRDCPRRFPINDSTPTQEKKWGSDISTDRLPSRLLKVAPLVEKAYARHFLGNVYPLTR